MLDPANPDHAHIAARLSSDPIVWLGSVRPDGRPHLVPVWFLWDGEALWIFSRPRNQKIINLRHNPHVILALDDSRQGADPIVIEGRATLLEETALQLLPKMGAYVAKYGERMRQLGYTAETMAADYSQPIRVTPTRLIGL
jgi:PPOX class probable F420-dependent enzyme